MTRLVAAMAVIAGVALGSAHAQIYPDKAYPDRPIKLIVPFVPGSPVDVLARVVS
jgi:tripartite-type tricarboxylate transporter receptor subunit TctC